MHKTTNSGWWGQNIFLMFPVLLNTKCDTKPSNPLHGGWQHGPSGWRETSSTPVKHHTRTKILPTSEKFLWLGTGEMWLGSHFMDSAHFSPSLLPIVLFLFWKSISGTGGGDGGVSWGGGTFRFFCLSPSCTNDINTSGTAERKSAFLGRLCWLRNRKQPQRRCMEQ